MSYTKADRDYYIVEEIREACIKNEWFYYGTNEQYEEMFSMAKAIKSADDTAGIIEVSHKITDCSGSAIDGKDYNEIYENVEYAIRKIIKEAFKNFPNPATKEEELKAVEKIEKIIHSLGAESYVGKALEGCLDLARRNIEDDEWNSYKSISEYWYKEYEQVYDSTKDTIVEAEDYKKQTEYYKERFESTKASLEEEREELARSESHVKLLEAMLEAKNNEVIKLKAKLYDLMVEDTEK